MSPNDPAFGSATAAPSRGAAAAPKSLRATLDAALEDALALTASSLGYLAFYDEETRRLTMHAWSRDAMRACNVVDQVRLYDLDGTGIWGDVVRRRVPVVVNDFDAPNPAKRGYPEGHAPLHRYLSIPVFEGDRIVAVVGVANKREPYDEADLHRLEAFMSGVWPVAQRLAVEEQQRKLSAIVEQSPMAIATCDVSGRIDYVNARLVEWLGGGRERLLGRHIQELNPVQAPDPAAFWDWLRAGGSWEQEVRLPGGPAVRHARVTVSPLRAASGAVSHYAIVAEDVSARRALEEQLRHVQRLESIGTLAGGIAHDFNNVLTGAIGLAADVHDALAEDHAARADVVELLGVLRRAAGLTRTLLTFARRESAALSPEPLAEVLEGVARLVRPGLGEHLELGVSPPTGDVVVEADRGQLEQVLVNLATNARDAMPGGGRLVLSGSAVDVGAAQAARHRVTPGAYAMISVEDSGVGMDEATLARIFDPFFTTKDVGKGTGLGLSMVYGIVRQHLGFVEVRSTPGVGSRFDVYLPRRSAPAPAPVERASPPPRGHGEAVLLAEDEPVVRTVWSSLLRRHGYEVVAVEDGLQAVEAFRGAPGRFRLVLMDVTMPRLGGPEAAAAIRQLDPGARVLFASGYPPQGAVPTATILEKPIAPDLLLQAVRRELDRGAEGGGRAS
jgi:PAS domain S-box-containing protein